MVGLVLVEGGGGAAGSGAGGAEVDEISGAFEEECP